MIFATHFGRPLPRWADEGACTTVEHASEKAKQQQLLITFLTTGRGIAFNRMFAMKDYPSDILPLYSQGYSLARYLIALGGKQKFVAYVGDGMNWNNWTAATQKHYGFESLSQLQVTWLDWVRRGSPAITPPEILLAQGEPTRGLNAAADASVRPAVYDAEGSRTAATPAVAQVGAEGWYVRQRDRALARAISSSAATPEEPNRPISVTATQSADAEIHPSSLSRPQAAGSPLPSALQWADGPGGSYLQPAPAARVASPVPYDDAVPLGRY